MKGQGLYGIWLVLCCCVTLFISWVAGQEEEVEIMHELHGKVVTNTEYGLLFGLRSMKEVDPAFKRLLLKKGDVPGFILEGSSASKKVRGEWSWWGGGGYLMDKPMGEMPRRNLSYGISLVSHPEILLDFAAALYFGIQDATVTPEEGTLSAMPVGADITWFLPMRTHFQLKRGKPKFVDYYYLWGIRDSLWFRVDIEKWTDNQFAPQDLTLSDILLAENVVRKVIANYEGRPFQILGQAPKDWKVMPASLVWQGKKLKGEGMAVSYDGEVYVSTKALLAMGMKAWRAQKPKRTQWEREDFKKFYSERIKQVAVRKGETKLEFRVGEKLVVVNGRQVQERLTARLIDGEPMVPLEVVARAFGVRLVWDETRRVARLG